MRNVIECLRTFCNLNGDATYIRIVNQGAGDFPREISLNWLHHGNLAGNPLYLIEKNDCLSLKKTVNTPDGLMMLHAHYFRRKMG